MWPFVQACYSSVNLKFSNAKVIPVYFAVRTSRVALASEFSHQLRNQEKWINQKTVFNCGNFQQLIRVY